MILFKYLKHEQSFDYRYLNTINEFYEPLKTRQKTIYINLHREFSAIRQTESRQNLIKLLQKATRFAFAKTKIKQTNKKVEIIINRRYFIANQTCAKNYNNDKSRSLLRNEASRLDSENAEPMEHCDWPARAAQWARPPQAPPPNKHLRLNTFRNTLALNSSPSDYYLHMTFPI